MIWSSVMLDLTHLSAPGISEWNQIDMDGGHGATRTAQGVGAATPEALVHRLD